MPPTLLIDNQRALRRRSQHEPAREVGPTNHLPPTGSGNLKTCVDAAPWVVSASSPNSALMVLIYPWCAALNKRHEIREMLLFFFLFTWRSRCDGTEGQL